MNEKNAWIPWAIHVRRRTHTVRLIKSRRLSRYCTNADERDIIVRFVQMIEGFSSGHTDSSEPHIITMGLLWRLPKTCFCDAGMTEDEVRVSVLNSQTLLKTGEWFLLAGSS